MQRVERLKSLCVQYAAATQWFISSSIDIPNLEEPYDAKQCKSRSSSQVQKVMTKDAAVTDSIL